MVPSEVLLGRGKYKIVGKEEVTDTLWDNLATATDYFRPSDMPEMFMQHFKYETPSQKRMMDMLKDEPFELVQRLKILAQRRTFKGTCDVYKGWY